MNFVSASCTITLRNIRKDKRTTDEWGDRGRGHNMEELMKQKVDQRKKNHMVRHLSF
jgi:hypothetical protein